MKQADWKKIVIEEVEIEKLSDKISRQMLNGEHTTMARVFLKEGAVVRRHRHPSEQFTLVLSGAMKLSFDERETVLRPGEMVLISPNIPHEVQALEETTSLDIFGPWREDWISKDDAYLRA